ncbi:hypothetical protein EX895_001432 [Sporisorium graminicola]|uniref:Uncharacterized protein n=1 Tax=Sporisorium graminicola TaxID=280036 RepID=A0A4U7KZA8_9BASI|nr:hypothetical protein EX895_001432 [Sporisorium graminicola]TKY89647.1 hypothetical protein EX895_001432 [Sporisorium graminicola]
MQASPSEYSSRSDDESEATYASSVTAISSRYLTADHKDRPVLRYVSDSNLTASFALQRGDLVHLPQQQRSPRRQLIIEPSTYSTAHSARAVQSAAVTSAGSYLEMFPMPSPRAADAVLRKVDRLPKSLTPELEELEVTREGDALEAAWDDESCIDGFTPRMDPRDRFVEHSSEADQASALEDRFEVDALRRQVEQLQMALQLQSQQLARAESEKMQVHLRPRRLSQRTQQAAYLHQGPPSPPPTGPPPRPQQSPARAKQAAPQPVSMHGTLLGARSATGVVAPMPYPSLQYVHDAAPHRGYYERATTAFTAHHPFVDRHEAETSHPVSPSPSTNPTLVDVDKLDHLNRKVAELEQLIGALNVNVATGPTPTRTTPPPSQPHAVNTRPSSRATSTPDSAAFQYNTTHPPTLTSSSSASIRSSSSSFPTPKERKSGKLAAKLGLKRPTTSGAIGGNGSTLSLASETTSARVSWSRKRTERVVQPKVKVRQGPGRGRMVIRETAA